jgi:hypothetical protein
MIHGALFIVKVCLKRLPQWACQIVVCSFYLLTSVPIERASIATIFASLFRLLTASHHIGLMRDGAGEVDMSTLETFQERPTTMYSHSSNSLCGLQPSHCVSKPTTRMSAAKEDPRRGDYPDQPPSALWVSGSPQDPRLRNVQGRNRKCLS